MASVNIPTILAPLAAHLRTIAMHPESLPHGRIGDTELRLNPHVSQVFHGLDRQTQAAVINDVPRIICAIFALSWMFYQRGLAVDGRFFLRHHKSKHLVMIASAAGLNYRCQTVLRRVSFIVKLLETFQLVRYKKAIELKNRKCKKKAKWIINGLFDLTGKTKRLYGSVFGKHRGGHYLEGKLNEKLLSLALKRFIQLPESAFELDSRTFNQYLALTTQKHIKGKQVINIPEERVMRDAGQSKHPKSQARERRRLAQGLQNMADAGLIEVLEMGRSEYLRVKVWNAQNLRSEPPECSKPALERPKPAEPPPLESQKTSGNQADRGPPSKTVRSLG